MAGGRRRFGAIRKLPSDLYQARYRDPDGVRVTAPHRFRIKSDADRWLGDIERSILEGTYTSELPVVEDPEPLPVIEVVPAYHLGEYAVRWMDERPTPLAIRTREEYERLLTRYISPQLGERAIDAITSEQVRTWHAGLIAATRTTDAKNSLDKGPGKTQPAKAYRLLRAILGTAEADDLIERNPCRLKGAGTERPPERVMPTVTQVLEIAEVIEPHFKMLVLLAAFGAMRWGELIGLRRRHIDLPTASIRIEQQTVEAAGHRFIDTDPKSAAGVRTVHLPPTLIPMLRAHLDEHVAPDPEGRVFVGAKGSIPTRSNFATNWSRARSRVHSSHGAPAELHFHDLRHLGGTLAAIEGATLRELQARLGHASVRAALIYQHASNDRDAALALLLDRHLSPKSRR